LNIPAILVLEDGTVFEGISVGAAGLSVGEVVFNTAMTGYQEILTDPSYARQLVTLTYPHIGNTGCTDQDDEAARLGRRPDRARRAAPPSNWRSQVALPEWLRARGIVAIAGIDTRKLTRILRERGAQNGALMAGAAPDAQLDVDKAIEAARKFPGLKGMDLAKVVSTQALHVARGPAGPRPQCLRARRFEVQGRGLRLRGQAQHPAHAGRSRLRRDRGAGADAGRRRAGDEARRRVPVQRPRRSGALRLRDRRDPRVPRAKVPTFGICLGHQLLALAAARRP
jgi:carbamoyl-phosphate synthase small subunit